MTFSKILLATDGSGNADRALDAAIDLAKGRGASLTILHAVIQGAMPPGLMRWAEVEHLMPAEGDGAPTANVYGPVATLTPDRRRQVPYRVRHAVAEAIVNHARDKAVSEGVANVDVQLAEGDAAEAIADALEDGGHDLLVLGTRGHGTLRGLLVGSVSHKVLGLHACPVLVLP
jgi:nucleotide-binding universal stress UspA family protein